MQFITLSNVFLNDRNRFFVSLTLEDLDGFRFLKNVNI